MVQTNSVNCKRINAFCTKIGGVRKRNDGGGEGRWRKRGGREEEERGGGPVWNFNYFFPFFTGKKFSFYFLLLKRDKGSLGWNVVFIFICEAYSMEN